MTKILPNVFLLIVFTFALCSVGTIAHASEVTGTLSSNAPAVTNDTTGSLAGTVTGATGGGEGGGRSGSSGSGGTTSGGLATVQPAGQVLGATTSNIPSPAFPNAGEPADLGDVATLFVLALGGLALVVLMQLLIKIRTA
jgi:hypothetical protein